MITQARSRRLACCLLALAVVLPACSRLRPKKSDPANTETDSAPNAPFPDVSATNPQKHGAKWEAGDTGSRWGSTAIPIQAHQTAVTFGPPGCPVAVVGSDVYDLKTYKAIRRLPDRYEAQALHALSADGRYFASASKSPNQQDTAVTVWSTDTGKQRLQVPGQKGLTIDVLAFAHNRILLLGGREETEIHTWDVETGTTAGRLTMPDGKVAADKMAFTPDNEYFAHIGHDKVVIVQTATNNQVAVMAPPGPGIGGRGKRPADFDAVFVYAWSRGLAFSPSGSELALFSTHPTPRLLVWNTKGQLILDEPVPMPQFVSHNNTLEWMPDGSGWLVNGYLYDRTAKRVVVSIRVPFASQILPHILDKNRVIGVFGNEPGHLQTITIPWDKVNTSLQQLSVKAPSYLCPGEPISVELELARLRGNEAETRRVLGDALAARLARDSIPVAAGRPTILRLKLTEQAGETLPIYERQSPFDFFGKNTGRKATEAGGTAILELVAQGENQPLWRGRINAFSSRTFEQDINDATVRKSMLEHLTRQLNGTDMPYFIPKSTEFVALPAVVE